METLFFYFTKEYLILYGVVFFIGLAFGWFFKGGNVLLMFIAILVFAPVLDFFIQIDHAVFTVPFVLGFLVHTGRPLLEIIKR